MLSLRSAAHPTKRAEKNEHPENDYDKWPKVGYANDPSCLLGEQEKAPEQYYSTDNYAHDYATIWKAEALVFHVSAFVSARRRGSSCQTHSTIGADKSGVLVLGATMGAINHKNFPAQVSTSSPLNAFG